MPFMAINDSVRYQYHFTNCLESMEYCFPTITMITIYKRFDSDFFVGKQSSDLFPKQARTNIHEMNWTDCVELVAENRKYKIHFVPACHWSGRGIADHFKRLWGGFVVETPEGKKIFYAGDTGYCEVFKEIGNHFKEIDLSLLPIGAYMPRQFLCYQHIDPQEAVKIHKEIKAKQSLGIHWATFQLSCQKVLQPKQDLQKALVKLSVKEQDFICFLPGNTLTCGIPVLRPVFQSKQMKQITWLGHSTLVFQLQGINILVNPVFSEKLNARHRYTASPCKVQDLPKIDIILVSYNLPEEELQHPKFQKVLVMASKQVKSKSVYKQQVWKYKHLQVELLQGEGFSSFLIRFGDITYLIPENLHPEPKLPFSPTYLFLPIRPFANAAFQLQQFTSKFVSISPTTLVPINWGSFQHREENIVEPVSDIEKVTSSLNPSRFIIPVIGKSISL